MSNHFKSHLVCKSGHLPNFSSSIFVSGMVLLFLGLMATSAKAEIFTNTNLNLGYRVDKFDWSTAGDSTGNNPNIANEVTWKNLGIFQVGIDSDMSINEKFYVRGNLNYGQIFEGDMRDSDYATDDRTGESSREINNADDGYVWDTSVGIGYEIWSVDRTVGRNLRFIPMIGYSISHQNLSATKGFQDIPATGSFAGLDETYKATWSGPWVGADMWFQSSSDNYLIVKMEYHLASYFAEADWNLVAEYEHPVSFEHEADGKGYVMSLAFHHAPKNEWQYSVRLDYQRWVTQDGLDRKFFTSAGVSTCGSTQCDTRLNEVNWSSYAFLLNARLPF